MESFAEATDADDSEDSPTAGNGNGKGKGTSKVNDLPDQSAKALKNSKAFQNLDNTTKTEVVSILDSMAEQQQRSGTVTEVVPVKDDTTPATVISIGSGNNDYKTLTLNQSKTVSYQKQKNRTVEKEYQEKVEVTTKKYLVVEKKDRTYYTHEEVPTKTEMKWVTKETREGGTWEYWGMSDFPNPYDWFGYWDHRDFGNWGNQEDKRVIYKWHRADDYDCGLSCVEYRAHAYMQAYKEIVLEKEWRWVKNSGTIEYATYKEFDSDSQWRGIPEEKKPYRCRGSDSLTQTDAFYNYGWVEDGQFRFTKAVWRPCKKTSTSYKWVTKTKNVTETYFVEANKTKSFDTNVTTTAQDFPSGGADNTYTLNKPGRATEFAVTIAPNSLPLKPKDHFKILIDQQDGTTDWIEVYVDEENDVIVINDDEGNTVKKEKGTVLAFNFHDETLNGLATELDVSLPESGDYQVKLQNSDGIVGSLGLTMMGNDMESASVKNNADVKTTGGMAEARFRVTFQTSGSTYTETFDANPSYAENIADIGVAAGGNVDPEAGATAPDTVVLGDDGIETVGVFAAGSTDEDGTIQSYEWSRLSGPSTGVIINNKYSKSASLTFDETGTYRFQVKVTDDDGATDTQVVEIDVIAEQNEEPNVKIDGPTQTNNYDGSPITVTLDGTANDPDGLISGYSWTLVSGDASAVTILSRSSEDTQVEFSSPGTYTFQLSATDNGDPARSGEATITVQVPDSSGQVSDTSESGGGGFTDDGATVKTSVTGDRSTLTGKTKTYTISADSALQRIDEVYSWKYRKGDSGAWSSARASGTSGEVTFDKGAGTYEILIVFRSPSGTQKKTITVDVEQKPSVGITTNPGYSGSQVSSEVPVTFQASVKGDYDSVTWSGIGSGSGSKTTTSVSGSRTTATVLLTDVEGTGDSITVSETFQPTDTVDSDNDRLTDGQETSIGTDPLKADTDGDGLRDFDEYGGPTDPLKADTDGDGINDAVDAAPTEAEDADPFEEPNGPIEPDGRPEDDFDGDGILDTNDECPTEAEDDDGYKSADGCYDPRSSDPVSSQTFDSSETTDGTDSYTSTDDDSDSVLDSTDSTSSTDTSTSDTSDTSDTSAPSGGNTDEPLSLSATGTEFTTDTSTNTGSTSDSGSSDSGSSSDSDTTLGGSGDGSLGTSSGGTATTIAF